MSYNLQQLGCTPFQVNQFGPEGNGSFVYCTPSGSQNSCFQFQNPVDIWVCPTIPVPGEGGGVVKQPINGGVAAQNAYLQNQALQNGQAYLPNGQAALAQSYLQGQALQNGQVLLPGQTQPFLQGQNVQGLAQNALYGARTF